MTHSILPPSSMARIVQCPGSVVMEASYPEGEPDQPALDGEASHWGASEMLQGRLVDIGDRAPNGVVLDQAMVEGADMIFDDVTKTLAPFGLTPAAGAAEVTMTIEAIHPLCFGTPDYRVWVPSGAGRPRPTLYVWDYKFGFGPVEVFENWQLIAYSVGAIGQTRLPDTEVDVVARIVQPRAPHREGPIREWRFNGGDLRGYINRAVAAANEALGPNPRTIVGPECTHCRARHACPTLATAAATACDVAGKAQPFDPSPTAMGVEMRHLARAEMLLKARKSGLEEQMMATIRRGAALPGWAIQFGPGRTVWTLPDAQVIEMAQMLGVDIAKPVEAKTPLQAKAAGLTAALVDGISKHNPGAASLVPDDGSRARQVFGGPR